MKSGTPIATARFELQHPITIEGVQVTRLVLRPKIRDLRRAAKQGRLHTQNLRDEDAINQLALITGVAPRVIVELDFADSLRLCERAQAFWSAMVPAVARTGFAQIRGSQA